MRHLLALCLSALSLGAFSQGCSDAGFCSLSNSSLTDHHTSKKYSTIRIGSGYGLTKYDVNVISPFIEYTNREIKKLTINAKLTMLSTYTDDVRNVNLGDFFLTGDYHLDKEFAATIGFKLPINPAKDLLNDEVLPMDFQSTLGTFDFLFGLKYHKNDWTFGAGWQQPLTQNKNSYLSDNSFLSEYTSTNKFYRNSDVWFRASRDLFFGEKVTLTPTVLAIYHLAKDHYRNLSDERVFIDGSDGLTFNIAGQFDYMISEELTFGLNFGLPLINRDVIPDGTSRKYQATADMRMNF